MAKFTGIPWDIVLQGFHWESHDAAKNGKRWWSILRQCAPRIKEAGFTWVWFPPCSDSLSPEGYMPRRWFALDTRYGSGGELAEAIEALAPECRAMADLVLNHRVGTNGPTDFTDPRFGPTEEDNLKAIVPEDSSGRGHGHHDTGEQERSSRDLDHRNENVQRRIGEYMGKLMELGFRGWRYDFVKGYDGLFVGHFNQQTLTDGELSIGEYLDGDAGKLLHWLDQTDNRSAVFDYRLRYDLLNAVQQDDYGELKTIDGKPAGVLGQRPEQAATFLDNHDTEARRGGDGYFGGFEVAMGYAYLLTHPGIPCVFWPHFFDWDDRSKQAIAALMKLRHEAGLTSASVPNIFAAQPRLYAATIDDKVAVKLGSDLGWQPPGDGWRLAVSGERFAVWRR